jgi:acyl transferase domain-containing protein/3-hydroxymyristoyl/3-hydroxydecanoyl-(acyl carrier protein) dehydratase
MKPGPTVAIVGIGGIFPGATGVDPLWDNIVARRDLSREPPPGRWSPGLQQVYAKEPGPDHVYSRRACFVDDIRPDLDGLAIDATLVQALDPMFGLLLHAGRQAWFDTVTTKLDRKRTGIIIGNIALPTQTSASIADELLGQAFATRLTGKPPLPGQTSLLNRYVAGLPASVLAHALGLGGTCYTLDAACASSLYSLKYAIAELQAHRADAMLCGGLSRPDSLYTQMGFSTLGALSPSGRCSPFDSKADGLVVGEGAGIVILKRLEDALRDQDHIYATIAGTGISNDIRGNLMLPDSEGQLRAMRAAYAGAGWQPETVDLIECHGTGTPAGDSTEFQSMRTLWGEQYRGGQTCVIGSVKSNIGHLLTAAGSAGLIKVLLAFKHHVLPPTANFERAASGIDLDNSPFTVLERAQEWQARAADQPRRAAVSAFGFGGINAHVLLEQWVQPVRKRKKENKSVPIPPAIAIVGMDACFGPWRTLTAFTSRVLGELQDISTTPANNRWGLPRLSGLRGYTIDQVEVPVGRFRIPPKELQDMLPQQLLMLQVAANALDDAHQAGPVGQERTDAGVFIGIGLDLNTTNFHLRWTMTDRAREWVKQSGIALNADSLQQWTDTLKDQVGPPLTANRTMGALGGIVASRIARAFNFGGAGFTVSAEESSGMFALQTAIRALQANELNIAIVGAVDLAGDARAVAGQDAARPYTTDGICRPFAEDSTGTVIGEGAVAFVLKRQEDAVRDGDRIYALVTGVGSASGGDIGTLLPSVNTYTDSLQQACTEADITPDTISCIETYGSGHADEDRLETGALCSVFSSERARQSATITSVKADIGHTGAASGLASVAKVSLALYHRVLPPLRNVLGDQNRFCEYRQFSVRQTPQYWLRDRLAGPRRALATSISTGGTCCHVVLEQAEHVVPGATETPVLSGGCHDQLFSIEADERARLHTGLDRLARLAHTHADEDIAVIARRWYESNRDHDGQKRAISLLASSPTQLLDLITQARELVDGGRLPISDRLYYTDQPLADAGKIAFVFPGSGNHFRGMGRDIACRWPQVLENLDSENGALASQFARARFWSDTDNGKLGHQDVIFGQVWIGTFVSDVISGFGVRPDAIIGYSLGETAGLFATRTWRDRDLMLQRIRQSTLFTTELAGPCTAARQCWGLSSYVDVDWLVGVIQCPAEQLAKRIQNLPWVYLLIINTPEECVIGGNRIAVESLVKDLACSFHPLDTITTVHCEVAKPVEQAYRELHLFPTNPPQNLRFYSGILGRAYPVTMNSAADSIVGQAVAPFDYTRVINSAYDDGVRLFIEMGPGASCTRMIDRILQDRPHLAQAVCVSGKNGVASVLRTLALLNTHRVPLKLDSLYTTALPQAGEQVPRIRVKVGHAPIDIRLPQVPAQKPQTETATPAVTARVLTHPTRLSATTPAQILVEQMTRSELAMAQAHETYLRVANGITQTLGTALSLQMSLLQNLPIETRELAIATQRPTAPARVEPLKPALDRTQCLEFARGSIGKVLGPQFAPIDSYPTRVRLPDEPLMLVDRIIVIEGEPCSMGSGRVTTEHDIHPGAWYLDGGRIPTCIAVESGQADLFLSGYLGIDHITKGLAVYRLLDAEICFHDALPGPGQTIHYDIRIERFFRQGDTHLFRFSFEGTVNGKPLLSMKNGCAGFFTQGELDAGKGIVLTEFERRPAAGVRTPDWQPLATMQCESYTDTQIEALRSGDLVTAFGTQFAGLPLQQPVGLPGGRMTLVHRVLALDPAAGRYGLGQITGEADIHPDDWFLTCHFIDDQVMPGTLMYECCLHTLRIYLLRMGWVGEASSVVYEPVAGISSKLKCRGQVIASTSKVQYEITLKEIGYQANGTPYVIADALMYADGRAIVQMSNMSVQLTGLQRDQLQTLWQQRGDAAASPVKTVLFDYNSILAFATGKPSEAFGDRYLPFDQDRVIARLPGPPFQFLDRIVSIKHCEPWQLKAGAVIEGEYDVPADAWYFGANRQQGMPFSVLLEIALQPCGWLAAYLGSALTSETDLSFRNLGGKAVQMLPVTADTGTLRIRVKMTNVALSGGMIIQNYDYEVLCAAGTVYKGDTYFGFFSKQALANQVGIRDAVPYQPTATEVARARQFVYPQQAPYPADQMRMIDQIDHFDAEGGPHGLGYIRGSARVNPDAWFFKAHFYQDPVWPGSLGLESFIQLLKVVACERWQGGETARFESMALHQSHHWLYRGQIIPKDHQVTVSAVIKQVDDTRKLLIADGFLIVDGRIIYQMTDFTLRMSDI